VNVENCVGDHSYSSKLNQDGCDGSDDDSGESTLQAYYVGVPDEGVS